MMKKIFITMFMVFLIVGQRCALGNVYLWEANTDLGYSCCLHINDTDICNPQTRCTQYVKHDLSGILDYVVRLLHTEKSRLEPHHTLLVQVRQYVRGLLSNPYHGLGYRMLERRSVLFYHDILDAAFRQKDSKVAAKPKPQKNNDFVAKYLMKLGLLKKRR